MPPPPICPQARKYLDFLAAHPQMSRVEIEKAIGSGVGAVERWSKTYGEEFRVEEQSIRARFRIVEAKRRQAAQVLSSGGALPSASPAIDGGELDPKLGAFLKHYAALGNRTKAIQSCWAEGVQLQLEDVSAAINSDSDFRRRFFAIFERVIVEIEDGQIDKGREGKTQSALAVLRAHRPEKYGNRMRITVDGGLQLTAGDRQAVEESKGGAVRKFRMRAAKSAASLPGGVTPEDVVEGEVLREIVGAVGEGVN